MSDTATQASLTTPRSEQTTASTATAAATPVMPPLPAIDWSKIGQTAPARIAIGDRKSDEPLPAADIVILTWTSAEWSALDHVFLNSDKTRASYDAAEQKAWRAAWHPYTRSTGDYHADEKSGALWGSFQLVSITDRSGRPWRVLLFKSNSHLAHPPWIDGLSAMVRLILADTKADRIYSIGTAGGARLSQRLGDAVVTNAALLDLQRPENTGDPDNGAMFRCKTWFPATGLDSDVEKHLLFRMNQVVTKDSLAGLFAQLKEAHAHDPGFAGIVLEDLMNDPLRPELLGTPQIRPMKDVPLLTTDFYFIAEGQDASAYSFLEMDDAVIAREAEKVGARYAFVRNVSDPIVRSRTAAGKTISDSIRADWSGKIYETYGFYSSMNGAIAAWTTIASEGEAVYNPTRVKKPAAAAKGGDPLEVSLVRDVRSCGTCDFFWPESKKQQPYGPYTAYDFDVDVPYAAVADRSKHASRWVTGRTRPPAFPNPEIADGCRKAPIMTIGINPNLTAFSPGTDGTAWAYPNFTDANHGDAWEKYAWYYRFRTVYQERLDFDFVRQFILPEGQIVATHAGHITGTLRADDSPRWSITVRYDGDSADTTIELPGVVGDAPYALLCDAHEPNNKFAAGQVIAGRLSVPGGIRVDVLQQSQTYYAQFEPVLARFSDALHKAGHADAALKVGEDVIQTDMVACASPHWNPGFLGGTKESVDQIVDHCVRENAWAMKQLIQTRPAVLFIVSKSSWDMFYAQFGAHIRRATPLSRHPVDHDFTLLHETTDPKQPCYLELDVTDGGERYQLKTRVVITPHFSYSDNFAPQYRVPAADWAALEASQPAAIAYFATKDSGFTRVAPDPKYPNDYTVVRLSGDADDAAAAMARFTEQFPAAAEALRPTFVQAHAALAGVLEELYASGALAWHDGSDKQPGYLARGEGSCHFCVNEHWSFYKYGCPYGKDREAPPTAGFLEHVAAKVVATGRPSTTTSESSETSTSSTASGTTTTSTTTTTSSTTTTTTSSTATAASASDGTSTPAATAAPAKGASMTATKSSTIYAIRPAGAGLAFDKVYSGADASGCSLQVTVRIKHKPYLFGYDRTTEKVSAWALNDEAPYLTARTSDLQLTGGPWDNLETFVLGNEPYLVAYNKEHGRFSFFHVNDDLTLSPPYSLAMPRNTPTAGFATIKPFTSLGNQYILGYDFESGHVAAFSVNVVAASDGGVPPLLMLNVWYHQWAKGWTHFAFFKLGGSTFFFKINTAKLNVNIDHLQDNPAAGSVEVGSYLQSQLPEALQVTGAAPVPWAHGEPYVLTYVSGTGAAKLLHVQSDCLGWSNAADTTIAAGATLLTPYRIGDTTFVLVS